MLKLGEKVIIVRDKLEMNLPVGSYGFIIAYDKNPDSVFDYVVRVPSTSKHYYALADDVEQHEELLRKEAERVEKEALIDYALATHNLELFNRVMNVEVEAQEKDTAEPTTQSEFIKQIHLKAWI